MHKAVIYARVSSREQQEEGYSIEAQQKLLRKYASQRGYKIAEEFIEAATAKAEGRKAFNAMLRFLEKHPDCKAVLVEKADRLYRNFKDRVAFENLDVELHLVKENQVLSRNSKSQVQLVHGFNVLIASHYSRNLKEEVEKGMQEKAEQGHYPAKAPFGYRNNKETRGIDPHPLNAPVLKRIYELYASGQHSLNSLRRVLKTETGVLLSKGYLETVLKNRFYIGLFTWKGQEYEGKHKPLIAIELFKKVQRQFTSKNKPKYQRHEHAFSGLLVCSNDGHQMTAETQKGRYKYYRCSNYGKDRCRIPYLREEKLSDDLAQVLEEIRIPADVCAQLVASFQEDEAKAREERDRRVYSLQMRLQQLRSRMDKMYEDKLDGKIEEEFWQRKSGEWRLEEKELQSQIQQLEQGTNQARVLDLKRIVELAQSAWNLYLTRNHTERAQLLKKVLLNCATDGVSLTPSCRKPFEVIHRRMKNEEWSGKEDLNLRPPGPEPGGGR